MFGIQLEMEIEELKEANMVVRQPGIDTYVEVSNLWPRPQMKLKFS